MSHILAYDGGGSRTRVGLYDKHCLLLAQAEGPPSNPTDGGVHRTVSVLARLHRFVSGDHPGPIDTVVAAIAGASDAHIADRIADGLLGLIPADRILVTHDAAPLILANLGTHPGVLVIAGTGSSIFAQTSEREIVRAGGQGPLLGDTGSAYRLVIAGLRAAAECEDGGRFDSSLPHALRAGAQLDRFDEFIHWTGNASRFEIAGLAPIVVRCAEEGDALARQCVELEAAGLAALTKHAAKRGQLNLREATVFTHGGLIQNAPLFRELFTEEMKNDYPGVTIRMPEVVGHNAAAQLAIYRALPRWVREYKEKIASDLGATERKNEDTPHLDSLDAGAIAGLMCSEELVVSRAVGYEKEAIALLIEAVADRFKQKGRLVYIGAGTSGRLGILDASECPPTFGVSPAKVVGIIAGGREALQASVEGAEDDASQAAKDFDALSPPLNGNDFVVGISASGGAPYVRAGLDEAKRREAGTALVCCNPDCYGEADHVIILDTGPEVLPGSTRLKAGTATKMVLNQISTGAMALSGLVFDGLMVGVQPSNAKLRARAIRIVRQLAACSEAEAERLLEEAGNRISVAVIMRREGIGASEAESRLERTGGNLRAALYMG